MAHTWTWEKLANNSYRLNPKSRGPKYPYTPKWETLEFTSGQNKGQNVIVPYVGTKTLLISLRAWGVTQSALHAVTLLFHDVDIQTTNPNDRNYFQIQYNGQMYWIHKLDRRRNPLTARCSCFTGDTKVLLADGTVKTFKELEGTLFQVNSFDKETNQFVIADAGNSSVKKFNAEVIELTFSDGSKVKCTPDHKFYLTNTEICEAKDLLGKTVLSINKDITVTEINACGKEDVYCLTVPEYGNFCLENGVTVANCKDFIFTWAWYNYYNAHCLYGPPPKPYKKKTNRKPRNPHGMPGICKHVYNAWAYLRNSGLTMD